MTSRYVDTAAKVAAMAAALAKHLDQPGSLHDHRKRQAAYIIEDIEPFDCVNLDGAAYRNEEYRRTWRASLKPIRAFHERLEKEGFPD